MNKIGIIAGEGELPWEIYTACIKNHYVPFVIGMKNNLSDNINDIANIILAPDCLTSIINILKKQDINEIIFAGRVKKYNISKLLLDRKGAILLAKMLKSGFNENNILSLILDLFKKEGFTIVSQEKFANHLMPNKGVLTAIQPNASHLNDIEKGSKILKDSSKINIGQGLIIQNGLILGIETIDGTDNLIQRCGAIQEKNNDSILIKMMRPDQDILVDLPCIGINTIEKLYKHSIKGVAIEANKSFILNKEQTINLANQLQIFIIAI